MWWLTLIVALGVMGLLQRITAAGSLDARAALALGCLAVVAYAGGEIARQARLPRLTGFLVAAFAAGPAWLGLVRADELEALRFVQHGALALVAFAAGAELRLAALRADWRPLLRITAAAIVAPLLAVGFVALTVSPWFPLTAHQPLGDALAVVLVLAIVSAVSSPALTIGVINERGARGPLGRAVLGVTVAQDLVAVVLVTVVLAVLRGLTSPGALTPPNLAWGALARLAGSAAAGVLLGVAVGQYLKVIRRHAILLLVAVAFVVAQAIRMLGLEAMLMAVAAGFAANVRPAADDRLGGELQRVALPVSLLFFALLGAGLRPGALRELWPWVLLFVGVRATSLWVGMRWAARHPAVRTALGGGAGGDRVWLGLISQAGLAVWLAALVRQAFPEWGISLEA
ncbi:MAG: cation:proton antiporter, partial [Gemmatimonadales bacterium]